MKFHTCNGKERFGEVKRKRAEAGSFSGSSNQYECFHSMFVIEKNVYSQKVMCCNERCCCVFLPSVDNCRITNFHFIATPQNFLFVQYIIFISLTIFLFCKCVHFYVIFYQDCTLFANIMKL
jgi:hypothetical protein